MVHICIRREHFYENVLGSSGWEKIGDRQGIMCRQPAIIPANQETS